MLIQPHTIHHFYASAYRELQNHKRQRYMNSTLRNFLRKQKWTQSCKYLWLESENSSPTSRRAPEQNEHFQPRACHLPSTPSRSSNSSTVSITPRDFATNGKSRVLLSSPRSCARLLPRAFRSPPRRRTPQLRPYRGGPPRRGQRPSCQGRGVRGSRRVAALARAPLQTAGPRPGPRPGPLPAGQPQHHGRSGALGLPPADQVFCGSS